MATHYSKGGGQPPPIALIGQAIPMLTRHELEAVTERLLDALDTMDAPTEDMEPDDEDTAIDDGPCDGVNEDLEEEHSIGLFSDPEALRFHRDRIRQARCVPRFVLTRDWFTNAVVTRREGYDLWDEPAVPSKRQLFRRKRGVPRRPRG